MAAVTICSDFGAPQNKVWHCSHSFPTRRSSDLLVPLSLLNSAWTFGSSWFTYCWSLAWRILRIPLLVCEMSALVQNAGWMKHKPESRLPGEISITSDMQMTPPLWQKAKRNSKASWRRWRRRVKKLAYNSTFRKWRSWLWSHHFMGNRWGNSGNSVRLYFFGLQNHCRWWLQPWN